MDSRRCTVKIISRINGEEMIRTLLGEYARKGEAHIAVYKDYTGNVVTKTGMELCRDKVLVHRMGGFEGDMLFDPASDTLVKYNAYPVQNRFMLHTEEYVLTETTDELNMYINYRLYDESGNDDLCGEQRIKVTILREENG